MQYYSTNRRAPLATLEKAVVKGLAEDRGLYMPERVPVLAPSFFEDIDKMTFQDIAFAVASAYFGDDVEAGALRQIVDDTLQFDCPVRPVTDHVSALELFHGPTLAFKDVGARFMARLLRHFIGQAKSADRRTLHVLVATSGDTGSAVANGFLGVDGIHVHVLYPKGKVSATQECQFTTLGQNVTAVEVSGVFDDCQALVKNAFMDRELNESLRLTSANSINVARFLPQAFYYFHAYAQMRRLGRAGRLVICVPSGNFGNICAGLFARRMGLPVSRFIAANNANDVFYQYLQTGRYTPRASVQTVANAMDVGDPSNFARILDLYGGDHDALCRDVSGATYSDAQILETIREVHKQTGYICDPHGACACRALMEGLRDGEEGVFLETAHPAKFRDTVEPVIRDTVPVPDRLAAFMRGQKRSVPMTKEYADLRRYLLSL